MIPDNPNLVEITPATAFVVGSFDYPDNMVSLSELDSYEMGGIAIQDPSAGLLYQPWYGYWKPEDSTVYLCPNITGTPIPLFVEPDVIEFSFTFDQNMRWSTVTRTADNQIKHKWYDANVADYVTTVYSNVYSTALTLDDKRDLQVRAGVTDMILTYVDTTSTLHWRIQRDRFLVDYTHPNKIPDLHRITNFGMNSRNRLQWRFQLRAAT